MANNDRFIYYRPSGLPGEAVAYIRGAHPGYRLQEGKMMDDWSLPHFDVGGFDEATGDRTATGTLTDFLNNDVGWLIVHQRVRVGLTKAGVGPEKVQWLDVCLLQDGRELVGEYFVANILDVRKGVNEQRSKYTSSGPNRSLAVVVLRGEAVRGADVFRIREWPSRVYFSPRLRNVLSRANVTGVEWGSSRVE